MHGEFSVRTTAQDAVLAGSLPELSVDGQTASAPLSDLRQSSSPSPATVGKGMQSTQTAKYTTVRPYNTTVLLNSGDNFWYLAFFLMTQ